MAERFNLIRYKGVFLTLDGAFAMKCGLEPDVNSFVCANEDFLALRPVHTDPGDLEFWFSAAPVIEVFGGQTRTLNQPDLKISGIRMISWTPLEFGSAIGPSPSSPSYIPAKWRIRLSDFREKFVPPRGGRLMDGVVNPKSSKTRLSNSQLIGRCAAVMGGIPSVPPDVDKIPPPQDLKWEGSHAPKELEDLLDRVGAVAVPKSNGTLNVEMIGTGALPAVPTDRSLPSVSLHAQDRRGRTVVFASYPNANLERMILDGPSDDTFQYVAVDPEDDFRIKKLSDIPMLQPDPLKHFREEFKNVPQRWADMFRNEVYRLLKINTDKYGPQPLLRLARKARVERGGAEDGSDLAIIEIEDATIQGFAKLPVKVNGRPQQFINSTEKILVLPQSIDNAEMLRFAHPLLKFADDGQSYRGGPNQPFYEFLVPLENGDLKIVCAREERDVSGKLMYFQRGFTTNSAGDLITLSEQDTAGILANPGPDDIIIERPEWTLYKDRNEYINIHILESAAKANAAQLLKGSDAPVELRSAVGFFPIELSGKVAEISITQEPTKTQWKVNTWWLSQDYYLGRLREKEKDAKKGGGGGAFPNQAATQSDRMALGATGETQPVAMLNPSAAGIEAAPGESLLKITGRASRGGVYTAQVVLSFDDLDVDPESALAAAPKTDEQTVYYVNLDEQDLATHWLKTGSFIIGKPMAKTKPTVTGDQGGQLAVYFGESGTGRTEEGKTLALSTGADADAKSWTRGTKEDKALSLSILTGAYYDTTAHVLYVYSRTAKFDARGVLFSMSSERQSTVDTLVDCTTSGGG